MRVIFKRRNVFFLYMLLFTVLSILYLSYVFDYPQFFLSITNLLISYSIFDFFLCELFVLLLAAEIFVGKNIIFRAILYVLSSIFIAIYYLQMISVNFGREFLSRLAIENMDHLYLLIDYKILLYLVLIILTCIMLSALTEMSGPHNHSAHRSSKGVLLFLIVAIIITSCSNLLLPNTVVQKRDRYLSDSYMDHTSPIVSLFSTFFLQRINYSGEVLHYELKAYELSEIKKFGFQYDATKRYPLTKQTIYKGNSPFPLKSNPKKTQPNVLIIFSEGLSARVIGEYGSKFANLTPNIDNFAKSSMTVRQYYNHTAATYRGLLGQLCSLYPTYGGGGGWQSDYAAVAGKKYFSLADLFANSGYETIFLDSHHKNHPSRVDEMIGELGFDTVVTGNALAKQYLNNEAPMLTMACSDRQYFDGAIGYLRDRAAASHADLPFFMALYNFGTHAFLQDSKDGVKYGDGRNSTLNNFHSFDYAFGRLWDYIKSSPYAENTIVILTADHAHYQEKPYVEAFSEQGYQKVFVDRIPLIIYDPLRQLPKEFDTGIASSIDFTPSLAHYFELENVKNPFLGTSIFEQNRKKYNNIAVACIGPQELFLIDKDRIHRMEETSKYSVKMKILDTYITIVKLLEMADKIWQEN